MVCYADDGVILAETENDLQRQTNKFHQPSEKYIMSISIDKTKCMTFSNESGKCKVVIDNKPIEQVMSFRYLRADTSSSNNLINDIKSQVNKAATISGCLRDIINPVLDRC